MKTKTLAIFLLVVSLSFWLGSVKASGEEDDVPQDLIHIPYDPFVHSDTLPEYPPYNNLNPTPFQRLPLLVKPSGIDLDVTYISRTSMYNRYEVWYTVDGRPYLRPGTENHQRWPVQGELVTFTAHVTNKGTLPSGSFDFKWYIDGVEVQPGTHNSLEPSEEGTETYQWAWAHSLDGERLLDNHTVRFAVDPSNTIGETYESNNSLEDRTDAISLILAVTPELYQALETPANRQWSYSAEDWLQKQIAAMNAAFARSVFSSAPNGIEERVRLDKIVITSTAPPANYAEDGGFFMPVDDRLGTGFYDPITDVSGGLIHELTHQLGVIDMYGLDVPLEIPQVLDWLGRPVQMEYSTYFLFPGLMNNPGIKPPIYDEHTTLALNANKGYRRGYYGEYLYDVPEQTHLRVMDNQGNAASGVTVKLYQRSSDQGSYGGRYGTIDNVPEVTGVTDNNGLFLLTNRSVGTPITTNTGHSLQDNPFAVIDVVGKNDEFIMELTKGNHQEYGWLDITEFNLAAWQGGNTIEIDSHVPPDNAPITSISLDGNLEFGLVELEWEQDSFDGSIIGYNVYRATSPTYSYQKIIANTTMFSYTDFYDYGSRAVIYAVTAVDAQGRESGFSNFFYALSLINPAAIAIDGNNHRIVLDPQNGYALLYQSPDGMFLDTRSSYDYHLEYSYYMVRDWQGRFIISHPSDYYTARQSVRIFDQNFNLVSEFGNSGTGPGQFQSPTGVAIWGQPCVSNNCRFLVADSGNNRIQVFDQYGNFISTYGTIGSGNGQFNNPQGLVVDSNGNVIVADSNNNRLQILNFNGTNLTFVKDITSNFSNPTGLAAYGTNYIIVTDTGNNKIKLLDRQGNLITEYSGPNDGHIGNFYQPRGVAVDNDGNLVVADTGNRRVVTILGFVPPTVFASLRANPSPTSANSVDFIVTFSEDVTGVDANDFALTTGPDISGAFVIGVSGIGATYTVTVNTGSGSGTIRLDIPVTATITDVFGNPLSGLSFETGDTYTVTKIPLPTPWVGGVLISSDKSVAVVGRPHIGAEVASYAGFSAGAHSAYIPMLFKKAFGGGAYNSDFYIHNVDSATANITIEYYNSLDGAKTCTVNDTVASLISKGYSVLDLACLPDGWVGGVVVTSDQNIVANGRPHIGVEVMTYNSFSSGSLTSYLPMLFKNAFVGGAYDSAFYVQNVDPAINADVTIEYYNSFDGTLTCTDTDTIAPNTSKGYWLPTLSAVECLPAGLPDGWVGGVAVKSTTPIVTVGRSHVGTQITTYNGFSAGAATAFVPMLFKNAYASGSYDAALYIQNVNPSTTATLDIKYYDLAGTLTCTVTTETIAPLASKGYWLPTLAAACLPDGWVGGAVVTSNVDIVAIGRPHIGAQVTTYNGFTTGSLSSSLPMLFKDAYGGSYDSAFYIQNTEATAATVLTKFYDNTGALTCTRSDTLAAFSTLSLWTPSLTCVP
jgi:sugar lactone lactonase YvrE